MYLCWCREEQEGIKQLYQKKEMASSDDANKKRNRCIPYEQFLKNKEYAKKKGKDATFVRDQKKQFLGDCNDSAAGTTSNGVGAGVESKNENASRPNQHGRQTLLQDSHALSKASVSDDVSRSRALHRVWLGTMVQPLLFPRSICCHVKEGNDISANGNGNGNSNSWEAYDMDHSGCILCGTQHICGKGDCPTITNSEGHLICTITGCCVRYSSYSEMEYHDNIVPTSSTSSTTTTTSSGKITGYKRGTGMSENDPVKKRKTTAETIIMPRGGNASENLFNNCHNSVNAKSPFSLLTPSFFVNDASLTKVNKKNRYKSWVHNRMKMANKHSFSSSSPMSSSCSSPMITTTASAAADVGGSGGKSNHWNAKVGGGGGDGGSRQSIKNSSGSSGSGGNYGSSNNNNNNIPNLQADTLRQHVSGYIQEILCTQKWIHSMKGDEGKLTKKKHTLLLKTLKNHKNSNPGVLPILPNIFCTMWKELGGLRITDSSASSEERSAIAEWCTNAICMHISLLNNIYNGIITKPKLREATIGLLYLMRNGIIMHGTVILPKLPRLVAILPPESHLLHTFGIKGKCVTETENVVKTMLRCVGPSDLERVGMAGVGQRLMGNSSSSSSTI